MSRNRATRMIQTEREKVLRIVEPMDAAALASRPAIPPMIGLTPDMLDWSAAMTLEHLALVNASIVEVTRALAAGRTYDRPVDYKNDFTPSPEAGPEQLDAFRRSVDRHLSALPSGSLRGPRTFRHIAFGHLDAHGMHCLFGLHTRIHRRQIGRIHTAAGASGEGGDTPP